MLPLPQSVGVHLAAVLPLVHCCQAGSASSSAPAYPQFIAALGGAIALGALILLRRWRGSFRRLEQQRNQLAVAIMLHTREVRREKQIVEQQKQQIEELLKQAQASNRAKDEFLANISHEIRTPLHGMIGMTELTLLTELTPEQREYLQIAEASANSLLALVNEILDFSKMEAGELALECLPFSVRECVEAAAASFAVAARTKGLEFGIQVASEVPAVIPGDSQRVGQILINLFSNALKFTERGSVHLDVEYNLTDDTVRFTVRDTGIGIPANRQDAIFERFRQADGSTTRKYGGTGLGLSISASLAKQMGGELTVESEAGRGSAFTLRLPVTPRPTSPDTLTTPELLPVVFQ